MVPFLSLQARTRLLSKSCSIHGLDLGGCSLCGKFQGRSICIRLGTTRIRQERSIPEERGLICEELARVGHTVAHDLPKLGLTDENGRLLARNLKLGIRGGIDQEEDCMVGAILNAKADLLGTCQIQIRNCRLQLIVRIDIRKNAAREGRARERASVAVLDLFESLGSIGGHYQDGVERIGSCDIGILLQERSRVELERICRRHLRKGQRLALRSCRALGFGCRLGPRQRIRSDGRIGRTDFEFLTRINNRGRRGRCSRFSLRRGHDRPCK